MEATQHLVALGPAAVELVDRTMIELGRRIPALAPLLAEFVRGDPAALLLVEFAEDDAAGEPPPPRRACTRSMADLGFRWGDPGKAEGGVLDALDPALQAKITEVRTQGLNIMMSMRSEGKPVSFVEDCAVHLAGPRRLHRPPDRALRAATAPPAPGTPTPRSACSTSARS